MNFVNNTNIIELSDSENVFNNDAIEYATNDTNNEDTDSFIKYLNDKMMFYENNLNCSYVNIKNIISTIEEEFPLIDINSFSEFFLICEEFYKLIQHSKQIIKRAEDFNKENEKLKLKIEKIKEKKSNLKYEHEHLIEDNKYKEQQIHKLENEIFNFTKEIMEMNIVRSIIENNNERKEIDLNGNVEIHKYINEIRNLTEEKNLLQRDQVINLKTIEKLENDLKVKYLPRHDTEKIILRFESEKIALSSRIKIYESNLEKFKREILNLKVNNDELKKELEKSEKKLEEFHLHSNNLRFYEENNEGELPLNLIFNEDDEEYSNDNFNKKPYYSRLSRARQECHIPFDDNSGKVATRNSKVSDKKITSIPTENTIIEKDNDIETKDNYVYKDDNNKNNSWDNNKTLFKEINHKEFLNSSFGSFGDNLKNQNENDINISPNLIINKQNVELKLTSDDIVSKMSRNEFLKIKSESDSNENSFSNSPITKQRISNKKISILENIVISPSKKKDRESIMNKLNSLKRNPGLNNEHLYKDFFMLTYKSLKLNYQTIEPFLYLNAEKLYKVITDKCIPFHKYYQFIKKEIKECHKKITKNSEYKKTKYSTVLDFISSQLF